jgi:adenosylcobinamide-phosphate synthase
VRATIPELLCGVALDLALGDPRWLPHPVRAFGWLVLRLERLWRATGLPLKLAGVLFCVTAVSVASAVTAATLLLLPRPWIAVYWIFTLLAIRDLDFEAAKVIGELRRGDLPGARRMLSAIVGRETAALEEREVLRATIETMAENLSDAVVAPLFYLALGGPVAMAVYKAANTLDSMVGYKNDRYREFGWASARFDDATNFIPARLTAFLVWLCAGILRYDLRQSITVTLRDARLQPSPNAGYPEAAVAGALGIRLGGLNYYQGVASRKPYLGDGKRPLDLHAYVKTRFLLYGSSLLMVGLDAGVMRWP